MTRFDPTITHGDEGMYRRGCRCDTCRASHAALRREWRLRKRQEEVPPDKHGLDSTYDNYNCRCQPCREAKAMRSMVYRARRQEGLI